MSNIKLKDLFVSKDGSLSLTKTFATIAHTLIAISFVYITVSTGVYNGDMWMTYIGAAILHAGFDKSLAVMKEIKTGQAPVANHDNT